MTIRPESVSRVRALAACALAIGAVLATTSARASAQDAPSAAAPARTLIEELEAAARLDTPAARATAAAALARRKDATVPALLDALRTRGDRFDRASLGELGQPGSHVVHANLWADGKLEDTEIVVYVPRSLDATRAAPLVLAFHGTGASGAGLDAQWGPTAETLGAIVVAPGEAGANEGYAFSLRERDAATSALRWALLTFRIDTDRVVATGISRGGHLAWDLALRRPDRFAALAPMIGCPRFQMVRGQNNLRFLENVAHVPIRDLQGSKDDPGVLQNLHEAFEKLRAFGARDARLIEFPDRGHSFDFAAVDWGEFFGAARRDPRPERVVLTAANLAEARAAWIEIAAFTREVAENPRIDVAAATWRALDATGQRRYVEDQIERETARVVATRTSKGHFVVESKGVARVRLLLGADDFDPSVPIEVTFGGKLHRRKVAAEAKRLAAEWVERLDPSFLPVAAVEIP